MALVRAPEAVPVLAAGVLEYTKLSFAEVVNHAVYCETTLSCGLLHSRMLFEHFEALENIELRNADSSGVIVRKLL